MASETASETAFPLPGFIPGDDAGSDGPASAPHQDSPAPDAPPSGTRADDMDDEAAFNTRFTARLREHENEQRMRWQAQVEQWRREVARDPDLGGDNLFASVARATGPGPLRPGQKHRPPAGTVRLRQPSGGDPLFQPHGRRPHGGQPGSGTA